MKAYKVKANKSGKRFAIVRQGAGFVVIAESKNYSAGKTVTAWRVVQQFRNQAHKDFQLMAKNGMPLEEAEKLLTKKTK